jgi:hypothetical protein
MKIHSLSSINPIFALRLFCCYQVLMPQKFLNGPSVITILEQMSVEAVPECMARQVFDKLGLRPFTQWQ